MKTTAFLCIFGLVAPVLPGNSLGTGQSGWVDVAVDEGRLVRESLSWSPEPNLEVRLWHPEDSPGAGWLRVGGFQFGPLEGRPGAEGERSWGPGPELSTGHWGADLDLGAAEGWVVQTPETLAAGGQLRWAFAPFSGTLGADRVWSTALVLPDSGPWVDRYLFGVGWRLNQPHASGGVEGRVETPVQGNPTWSARGRAQGAWDGGLAEVGVRAAGRGTGEVGMTYGLSADVGQWHAGWTSEGNSWGQGQASWAKDGWSVRGTWRPGRLVRPGGGGRVLWNGFKGTFGGDASWSGRWEVRLNGGVEGRLGSWPASLDWRWDSATDWQCWEGRVESGPWEALVRWKTRGLKWGWLGPDSETSLSLRWRF